MSEFDDLIHVHRTDDGSGDTATYAGALHDDWSIGAAVNGGAVLAVVGSALADLLGGGEHRHPDPLSVSAVYLSPGTEGACEVTATVVRRGGRTSVAEATLSQEGQARIKVLATYTDLDVWEGTTHLADAQPSIPPIEDCFSNDDAPDSGSFSPRLMDRLDLRMDPGCSGWVVGDPSGRGLLQAWMRFEDGRDWDPLSLLLASDALPPTTFDVGVPGWAPTVELTVHLRAKPAPGFLHVRCSTRFMTGGLFEEDAEVWDSTGRLVAQSRQLAMVPKDAR